MITNIVWLAGARLQRGWRLSIATRSTPRYQYPDCQYMVSAYSAAGQWWFLAVFGTDSGIISDKDEAMMLSLCEVKFLVGAP